MLEYVKTNQYIYFSVVSHHPASGYLYGLDSYPKYWVNKRNNTGTVSTVITPSIMDTTDSYGPTTYLGHFYTSGNIFDNGEYYEVYVSGKCQGTSDITLVKSFRINDVFNSNVVQTSGTNISPFFGKDIYYSQIKYTKDNISVRDEYNILWYKNDTPLYSGAITGMGLSVYRGSDSSPVFQNASLSYTNAYWGNLRYNYSSSALASGEAYLAVTSGVIDGQMRTWQAFVGIDAL